MSNTKPCDRCAEKGRIPRVRRGLADGTIDPSDRRSEEICDRCGGSGQMPVVVQEAKVPRSPIDFWNAVT